MHDFYPNTPVIRQYLGKNRAKGLAMPLSRVAEAWPGQLALTPYPMDMSIDHISFSQSNRPITMLTGGGPVLDFDPPYQRGEVWSEEQRVNLIKSILQGLPIGVVFLNSRDVMEPVRVVDGKQRLLAIRDFLEGRLAVPREWFAGEDERPEHPDVEAGVTSDTITGLDLAPRGIRHFEMNAIATYETSFKTEDEERELYLRINFGGVAHTDEDRERAAVGLTPAQRDAQRASLRGLHDELVSEGSLGSEYLGALETRVDSWPE